MPSPGSAAMAAAVERFTPAGVLDASFGSAGAARAGGAECSSIAVQPDGGILAAGFTTPSSPFNRPPDLYTVARFHADGTPDKGFGIGDGGAFVQQAAISGEPVRCALALQPDGRILVAETGAVAPRLIRLTTDGHLDPTFGVGGITGRIDTDVRPSGYADVALLPDGRIVAAEARQAGIDAFVANRFPRVPGSSLMISGTAGDDTISLYGGGSTLTVTIDGTSRDYRNPAFAHIFIDGRDGNDTITVGPGVGPVTLFGGPGNDSLAVTDGANLIRGEQGDDTVVCGMTGDTVYGGAGADSLLGGNGNDVLVGGPGPDTLFGGLGDDSLAGNAGPDSLHGGAGVNTISGGPGNDTLVNATVDADTLYAGAGTADPSFANGGQVTFVDRIIASSVRPVPMPDGGLLEVGLRTITRLRPDGTTDVNFGTAGALTLDAAIDFVQPQPDGRLVVAQQVGTIDAPQERFTRLQADGSADPTFGTAGATTVALPALATSMIVTPTGAILIVARNGLVVRLTAGGTVDATFGTAGRAEAGVASSDAAAALDAQGRLVLSLQNNVGDGGSLVRLTASGALDPTFGSGGILTVPLLSEDGITGLGTVGVQPDGAVVVQDAEHLVRYTSAGLPDPTFHAVPLVLDSTTPLAPFTVQADGSILYAGLPAPILASIYPAPVSSNIVIRRFQPDGRPDLTFGFGGFQTVFAINGSAITPVTSVTLAPGGAVYVTDELNLRVGRFLTTPVTLAPDGTLVVTGTQGSDTITLSQASGSITVTINGHAQSFPASSVTQVYVAGRNGNDAIDASGLSIPVRLNGNNGNDTLTGGSANDTLSGGAGHDSLAGGSGDDLLLARDGEADTLDGGAGTDAAQADPIDVLLNVETSA